MHPLGSRRTCCTAEVDSSSVSNLHNFSLLSRNSVFDWPFTLDRSAMAVINELVLLDRQTSCLSIFAMLSLI